ncbi:MAG: protein-L-isoaspartate(D-aspartate) O-methyltransferase [Oligoflexia bacterium]|nr:protein-L-isoaspartate(D-aspartate) O-methyltransferase [Oligoflexia bacterium]
MSEPDFGAQRRQMVEEQLKARGISDPAVLAAMLKVPRHLFVPFEYRAQAYTDHPLPLGPQQTISQPFIVALMLQASEIKSKNRVLDIGTGSGYQTALLCELGAEVFSIEIDQDLHRAAERSLRDLGYTAKLRCGDGFEGWREAAPFDAIIVSACPGSVPRGLPPQLKQGGRLVLPVGRTEQELIKFTRTAGGLVSADLGSVRFVEMKKPH